MKTQATINAIEARLDDVIVHLIHKFGDEGHDIGDAGSAYELLANNCHEGGHDSHAPFEIADAIAEFLKLNNDDVRDAILEISRDPQWGKWNPTKGQ